MSTSRDCSDILYTTNANFIFSFSCPSTKPGEASQASVTQSLSEGAQTADPLGSERLRPSKMDWMYRTEEEVAYLGPKVEKSWQSMKSDAPGLKGSVAAGQSSLTASKCAEAAVDTLSLDLGP